MGLPPRDLEYRGKLELRGAEHDSLSVAVSAHNPTADSVTVQISPGCRGNSFDYVNETKVGEVELRQPAR